MSTQPGPASVPQPETLKHAPAITDAYLNARANYLTWASLLAFWELIGISLTRKNWSFEIESPPKWVAPMLFIVVIYCGYKMTSEWMLCNPECRMRLAPKWNLRTAHGIALIAITISIIQYLLHIHIADYITHHQVGAFVVIAVVMTAVGAVPIYSMHTVEIKDDDPETQRPLEALGISRRSLLALALSPAVLSCIETAGNGSLSLFFVSLPMAIGAWIIYRNRKKTEATKA